MKRFLFATAAVLGCATLGHAGSFTWDFNQFLGVLGAAQNFASTPNSGVDIAAYGYSCANQNLTGCTATDLYGKNGGAGEDGLGIYNNDGQNEIQSNQFVQLDLTSLFARAPSGETFTIQSVQNNEGFAFYQSGGLGLAGTLIAGKTSGSGETYSTVFTLDPSKGDFISLSATKGNVLLSGLTAEFTSNSPEPATLGLVGSALIGLASLRRRGAKR